MILLKRLAVGVGLILVLLASLGLNGMLPPWPGLGEDEARMARVGARTLVVPQALVSPLSLPSGTVPFGILHDPGADVGQTLLLLVEDARRVPARGVRCDDPGLVANGLCEGWAAVGDDIVAGARFPAPLAPRWDAMAAGIASSLDAMTWRPGIAERLYVWARRLMEREIPIGMAVVAASVVVALLVRRRRVHPARG